MIFSELRGNLQGYNCVKFKTEISSTFGENGINPFQLFCEWGISWFENEADGKTKMDAFTDQFLGSFKSNIKYLYEQFASKCANNTGIMLI